MWKRVVTNGNVSQARKLNMMKIFLMVRKKYCLKMFLFKVVRWPSYERRLKHFIWHVLSNKDLLSLKPTKYSGPIEFL